MHIVTSAPSSTHFASVPAQPNSTSSGWAETARTLIPRSRARSSRRSLGHRDGRRPPELSFSLPLLVGPQDEEIGGRVVADPVRDVAEFEPLRARHTDTSNHDELEIFLLRDRDEHFGGRTLDGADLSVDAVFSRVLLGALEHILRLSRP